MEVFDIIFYCGVNRDNIDKFLYFFLVFLINILNNILYSVLFYNFKN